MNVEMDNTRMSLKESASIVLVVLLARMLQLALPVNKDNIYKEDYVKLNVIQDTITTTMSVLSVSQDVEYVKMVLPALNV